MSAKPGSVIALLAGIAAFFPPGPAPGAPAAKNAPARRVCSNAAGTVDGYYFSFYRDSGSGCMTLGRAGAYATAWDLGSSGNLVAGKGWAAGSATRVVGYRATAFRPGVNGYLALYGWSTGPLVEYYVVDAWGDFVPPGHGAVALGTVNADGGVYRIYRTQRVNQPSILGQATFDQYWSVRTVRRPLGARNLITFARHVGAWRDLGLKLGALDYQVLATEGFGSKGSAQVSVWRR